MKQPPPEPRSCRNCWNAAGTRRETSRVHIPLLSVPVVSRMCRENGLMVQVTANHACCGLWQARPSNAAIAVKANADALDRMGHVAEKEEGQ